MLFANAWNLIDFNSGLSIIIIDLNLVDFPKFPPSIDVIVVFSIFNSSYSWASVLESISLKSLKSLTLGPVQTIEGKLSTSVHWHCFLPFCHFFGHFAVAETINNRIKVAKNELVN